VHALDQARLYRQARQKAGLTRHAVARAIGWSVERITELESGGPAPSLHEALQLAHLYVVRAPGNRKRRPTQTNHEIESCGRIDIKSGKDSDK
jgi:DNA-binding XRE family transcriptional regulator